MKATKTILTHFLLASILLLSIIQCKKDCFDTINCELDPESGLCLAAIPRFYYDKAEKKCKQFTWGGCGGVVPFETLELCMLNCECD